jgi:glycerol-3-phosphate acyltransferase PlsY
MEFFKTLGELFINGIVAYFERDLLMTILCYIITALSAYALGSLNFAVIISKLKYHDDIRKYGSGNAGMTNMLRTYGKADAALTFAGDMLKTMVSIVIGMLLVGSVGGGNYVAGFFAILGHVYPVYYKFKGGKGVVAAATTILMLDPRIFLILVTVFAVIVAISRYISLGSVVCAMLYPLLVYVVNKTAWLGMNGAVGEFLYVSVIFAFVIGMFVIILHRKNIERLMTGKESKISLKSKKDKTKKFSVENKDEKK